MTRFVDDGSDDGEGEVNDNAADDKEADMAYRAAVDKKQFVLNQLALAWKEGKTAGREKILEAAKKEMCIRDRSYEGCKCKNSSQHYL